MADSRRIRRLPLSPAGLPFSNLGLFEHSALAWAIFPIPISYPTCLRNDMLLYIQESLPLPKPYPRPPYKFAFCRRFLYLQLQRLRLSKERAWFRQLPRFSFGKRRSFPENSQDYKVMRWAFRLKEELAAPLLSISRLEQLRICQIIPHHRDSQFFAKVLIKHKCHLIRRGEQTSCCWNVCVSVEHEGQDETGISCYLSTCPIRLHIGLH